MVHVRAEGVLLLALTVSMRRTLSQCQFVYHTHGHALSRLRSVRRPAAGVPRSSCLLSTAHRLSGATLAVTPVAACSVAAGPSGCLLAVATCCLFRVAAALALAWLRPPTAELRLIPSYLE